MLADQCSSSVHAQHRGRIGVETVQLPEDLARRAPHPTRETRQRSVRVERDGFGGVRRAHARQLLRGLVQLEVRYPLEVLVEGV